MLVIPGTGQPAPLLVHSVGEGLGPSDGVYGGNVSTESGPWCLRIEGFSTGTRGVMVGAFRNGLAVCGGPIPQSVQPSGERDTTLRMDTPREKQAPAFSLSNLTNSRRDGNNLRHQRKAITSKRKQTD